MKVHVDRDLVRRIAVLARLHVNDQDLDRLTEQMKAILGYIEKLDELDLTDVEPTSHAIDLRGALRPDAVGASLPLSALLENAPDAVAPFVRVPKVIEGGGDA